MYRAGGPTTIFGGIGWGPFSDGPLNPVRKSLYNREGVSEENWMHVAAQRTLEESEEWTTLRREALTPCGGILPQGSSSQAAAGGTTEGKGDKEKDNGMEVDVDGNGVVETAKGKGKAVEKKRKRRDDPMPYGAYEPHTGLVHYRSDTQPTQCRWEQLPYTDEKPRILGGTRMGNGGWSLAWVDNVMELPPLEELDPRAQRRAHILNLGGEW